MNNTPACCRLNRSSISFALLAGLIGLAGEAAGAEETPMPKIFEGLASLESYYGCAVYFHRSVDFEMTGLKIRPNDARMRSALRSLLTMKTHMLLWDASGITEERRRSISNLLAKEPTEEASDVMTYCIAVSNGAEAQLTPRLRKIVDGLVAQEMREKLRAIGAKG